MTYALYTNNFTTTVRTKFMKYNPVDDGDVFQW